MLRFFGLPRVISLCGLGGTADERFALIWHKIERANKHIAELNSAIRAFGATNPYRVVIKRDPETRKPIYYDHLTQQLYLVGSGGVGYGNTTSFFIAPKASEYERLIGRKVEGMRKDAVDALRALEPYKGGNGNDFWVLHSLNNIEKHRAIVAAASALSIGLRPADNLCPLKEGDELFVDAADAEFDDQMKFTFDVAIYEPEIVKPRPMMEIIQHLANLVSNTVVAFASLGVVEARRISDVHFLLTQVAV